MAAFTCETFQTNNEYMTPRSAWEDIRQWIPQDKLIWEPFFGDGQSGQDLREMGFRVIHEKLDFFKYRFGQVIVSNPPFSDKRKVFTRLKELGLPFIMIAPSSMMNTHYIQRLFPNPAHNPDPSSIVPLQLIVPPRRIRFRTFTRAGSKEATGAKTRSNPNFDCFYYTWKIGLPRDIMNLPLPAEPVAKGAKRKRTATKGAKRKRKKRKTGPKKSIRTFFPPAP